VPSPIPSFVKRRQIGKWVSDQFAFVWYQFNFNFFGRLVYVPSFGSG